METDGQNLQHVGVFNAFAAAVLRGEPLVADGRDGIFGLSLSNAMHLSCWQNRPITLPISEEDEKAFYAELMERVKTSRRKEATATVISDTSSSYNN